MLEHRPILQRALYASGAFTIVFAAAMAGTGVMITGGPFPAFADTRADGQTFPMLPASSQANFEAPAPDAQPAFFAANEAAPTLDGGSDYAEEASYAPAPAAGEYPAAPTQTESAPAPAVQISEAAPVASTDQAQKDNASSNEAQWAQLERELAAISAEQAPEPDDLFGEQTVQQ